MVSRFPSFAIFAIGLLVSYPAMGQESATKSAPPPLTLPELGAGTSVTIPYAELKALWSAAQTHVENAAGRAVGKPAAPPVPYALQAARYEVTFGNAGPAAASGADGRPGQGVQVRATFDILSFAEGWTVVPLLPAGEVRLSHAGVEGGSGTVAVRDNTYALLVEGPGRRKVTLEFSADLTVAPIAAAADRHPTLRLTTPSAAVNELSVAETPAGWLPEVANATHFDPALSPAAKPDAAAPASSSAPATFHLTAGQPLVLTLLRAEKHKLAAAPPAPSRWQTTDVQALVRYDEGRLLYRTRIRVTADGGAGTTASFSLPVAAQVLEVASDDLVRWGIVKPEAGDSSGSGGGRREVQVSWKTADVLRRELFVTYELPQPVADGEWQLVTPRIEPEVGKDTPRALFVLAAVPGLEFLGPNGRPLPDGDARALSSRWLTEAVGCETFSLLLSDSASGTTEAVTRVGVRRLPLLRAAQATVEEARFRTRLVADGALLSEGKFFVRHDGSLTFNVALPEGSQLLTCAVNGRETAPVDRGGGKVEIALAACASGVSNNRDNGGRASSGSGGTQIALSYAGRQRPLAPVSGQLALALPQTDLFVQTLFWDLQIPAAYELTALEGNVELLPSLAAASTDAAPVIRLRKELLKAERPSVELFYQKRAVAP